MKRLIAFLLLSFSAFATTTVTGNIGTLGTGTVNSGAFVRFWLRGCAGNQPRITGTALIGPSQGGVYFFDFVANGSGAVSGTLYSTRDNAGTGNGDIECGGSYTAVWYGMQAFVAGKAGPEIPVQAKKSSTLDISTVTPITTNPVVASPTGDSTYARLDAGNQPFLGSITPTGTGTLNLGSSGNRWNLFSTNIDVAGTAFFSKANIMNGSGVGSWLTDGNVNVRASPVTSNPLLEVDMAPTNLSTIPVDGYFFMNDTGSVFGNPNGLFSQVQLTNFSSISSGSGPSVTESSCMLAGTFSATLPRCWALVGEAQTLTGWTGTATQMVGVMGQINMFSAGGTITTAYAVLGNGVSSLGGTITNAISVGAIAPSTGTNRYLARFLDSTSTNTLWQVDNNGLQTWDNFSGGAVQLTIASAVSNGNFLLSGSANKAFFTDNMSLGNAANPWKGLTVSGHVQTGGANSDFSGTISGTTTTAAKTFSVNYTSTPACVVTPTTAGVTQFVITTQSNSGFTVTYAPSAATTFNYVCIGNPT